jgi:hypothetical protein
MCIQIIQKELIKILIHNHTIIIFEAENTKKLQKKRQKQQK